MVDQSTKAIIFDFDGVLVDSATLKTEAFRQLYRPYGEAIVSEVVAYHHRHGGISRVEKIRYYHSTLLHQPLNEQGVAEWSSRFSDLVVEKVVASHWIAGAKSFLDLMSSKLPIFVISATPEEELKEIIKRRRMGRYFKSIHGSPVRKPEHIRNLLNRYQLEPARCLYVGDAMTDYFAAKDNGVPFIGIDGETPFPEDTLVLSDCTRLAAQLRQ